MSEAPLSPMFKLDDWSLVACGPSIRPPFQSIDLDEATDYALDQVAAAILGIPGVRLLHDQTPDWECWRARWTWETMTIDVEMTTWETDDGTPGWGGSPLSGSAGPQALHRFYSLLHEVLPCAWLHNSDCELHTADSFAARFGAAD